MLKLKTLKRLAAVALAAVGLLSFESCKTPPQENEIDPLSLLSPDGAIYLYVPVQSHSEFCKKTVAALTGASDSDSASIVKRIDDLYITTKNQNSLEVAASGAFPSTLVKFALTEKKGWKQNNYSTFSYFEHLSKIQLALPSSSVACISYDVKTQLDRFEKSAGAVYEPSDGGFIPEEFNPECYKYLTIGGNDEIRFFSASPQSFFKIFFNANVKLGVRAIYGVMTSIAGKTGEFGVKIILDMEDSKTVKAAIRILQLALFGTPAKIVQTGVSQITITDYSLTWNEILSLFTK